MKESKNKTTKYFLRYNIWKKIYKSVGEYRRMNLQAQLVFEDWTSERNQQSKINKDVNDLLEMIRIIPCQCHEGFTSRKLTDPSCPRCNWIDENTVNKVIKNMNKIKNK